MKWLGRGMEGEFLLSFTAAEVERLYDALDAENDRFEDWLRHYDNRTDPRRCQWKRI